jgi:hypothetical protein
MVMGPNITAPVSSLFHNQAGNHLSQLVLVCQVSTVAAEYAGWSYSRCRLCI